MPGDSHKCVIGLWGNEIVPRRLDAGGLVLSEVRNFSYVHVLLVLDLLVHDLL